MRESITKRLDRLEHKANIYDYIVERMAQEYDLYDELDSITNESNLKGLKDDVDAVRNAHKKSIIVTLVSFFAISALWIFYPRQSC